jgi:hypothetical protein
MKITHHCHRLVKNDRFVLFFLVARPSLAHDAPLLSPIPSRSPHACGCCCWPPPPLLRFWCRGRRRGRRSWRRWPTLCCGRTSSATVCCPWGPWPREAARPVRRGRETGCLWCGFCRFLFLRSVPAAPCWPCLRQATADARNSGGIWFVVGRIRADIARATRNRAQGRARLYFVLACVDMMG